MPVMPLLPAPTMSWLRSPIISALGGSTPLLQRVVQQIGLVDAGAVEFGAEHMLEIWRRPKCSTMRVGEHMRLAGGDEQPLAGLAQRGQRIA